MLSFWYFSPFLLAVERREARDCLDWIVVQPVPCKICLGFPRNWESVYVHRYGIAISVVFLRIISMILRYVSEENGARSFHPLLSTTDLSPYGSDSTWLKGRSVLGEAKAVQFIVSRYGNMENLQWHTIVYEQSWILVSSSWIYISYFSATLCCSAELVRDWAGIILTGWWGRQIRALRWHSHQCFIFWMSFNLGGQFITGDFGQYHMLSLWLRINILLMFMLGSTHVVHSIISDSAWSSWAC
jgi:hypothetical protein